MCQKLVCVKLVCVNNVLCKNHFVARLRVQRVLSGELNIDSVDVNINDTDETNDGIIVS